MNARLLHFLRIVLLLSLCLAVSSFSKTQAQSTEPLKAELRGLYEKLLLASKTKDKVVLQQILADNYSQVTADGRVRTKAIRISETMAPNDNTEVLALESFDLFTYENAAVARCVVRYKGTDDGQPFDVKILSTVTFVKEKKVWRIAATHLSFVK